MDYFVAGTRYFPIRTGYFVAGTGYFDLVAQYFVTRTRRRVIRAAYFVARTRYVVAGAQYLVVCTTYLLGGAGGFAIRAANFSIATLYCGVSAGNYVVRGAGLVSRPQLRRHSNFVSLL